MVNAHVPQKPSRQEKPLAMHGDYAMVVAGYDVKAMGKAIKVADEEAQGCTNVSKTFGAQVLTQTTKSPPQSRFRALRFAAQNYDKLLAFPLASRLLSYGWELCFTDSLLFEFLQFGRSFVHMSR
jgi:hypothetical protein